MRKRLVVDIEQPRPPLATSAGTPHHSRILTAASSTPLRLSLTAPHPTAPTMSLREIGSSAARFLRRVESVSTVDSTHGPPQGSCSLSRLTRSAAPLSTLLVTPSTCFHALLPPPFSSAIYSQLQPSASARNSDPAPNFTRPCPRPNRLLLVLSMSPSLPTSLSSNARRTPTRLWRHR